MANVEPVIALEGIFKSALGGRGRKYYVRPEKENWLLSSIVNLTCRSILVGFKTLKEIFKQVENVYNMNAKERNKHLEREISIYMKKQENLRLKSIV